MLPTTAESNNNTSGNGQFGSLTRRKKQKAEHKEFNIEEIIRKNQT